MTGLSKVLIVLDVDGTIARLYSEDEREIHAEDPGWTSWMAVDDAVVDALDAVATRPEVQVAWLTTWSPGQVSWLIDGPLRGRLAGPYVPHRNWPHAGWRVQSMISLVRSTRPAAVVWADDRVDQHSERQLKAMIATPTLVRCPNKFVGLTIGDIAEILRFLDGIVQS